VEGGDGNKSNGFALTMKQSYRQEQATKQKV